jgi:hypothetical protein
MKPGLKNRKNLAASIIIFFVLIVFAGILSLGYPYRATSAGKKPSHLIPLNQINEQFLRNFVLQKIPQDEKFFVKYNLSFDNSTESNSRHSAKNPLEFIYRKFYRYYIVNVHYTYRACDFQNTADKVIAGPNVTEIKFGTSRDTVLLSNYFYSDTKVSPDTVSNAVGFNVNANRPIKCKLEMSVSAGECGVAEAYPVYKIYTFDVMYKPIFGHMHKVGSGTAYKAVGLCKIYYRYKP